MGVAVDDHKFFSFPSQNICGQVRESQICGMFLIKSSKERLGGRTRKPDGPGVAEAEKEKLNVSPHLRETRRGFRVRVKAMVRLYHPFSALTKTSGPITKYSSVYLLCLIIVPQ